MTLACETCPVRDRAACSVLAEEDRAELSRIGTTRRLERGESLFFAGDSSDSCATLVRGALKVSSLDAEGTERILALVHPAGFTGELFQPFTHHDVTALTDSELCVFGRKDLEAALDRYPELARALLRRSQEDLFAARDLLALTGKREVRARLAGLILAMARAASDSPCHPAERFELPLSRGEIAAMLGTTIETISRRMTELERDEVIRRTGTRGIELADPARLADLAQG
ncbi:Crp/Fnr family transcriptional regulator [Tsuneonella suprasediminis]|uniref:Crp/Fnr family transcriptional regulator n=1 Tax=Tsuneonella suprasediminis TaxID=2306996 RepID=UPI002F92FF07